jgi:hypothetical protein
LNLLFCRRGFGLVVSVVVPSMLAVLPYARGRGFDSQSRLLYFIILGFRAYTVVMRHFETSGFNQSSPGPLVCHIGRRHVNRSDCHSTIHLQIKASIYQAIDQYRIRHFLRSPFICVFYYTWFSCLCRRHPPFWNQS